ncbi:SDR family oxidoreductase [Nocardia sp. NPDC050435]|uniref:SDR family oxidoreductase n=1 Tax=Nocardia sp. NPDC050435 TaxID=3155040 RepID=UPI003405A853
MTTQQIALITGANRGIGYETARQLGERGYTVLVGARDVERGAAAAEKLRAEGIDAHPLRIDATDAESIAQAAAKIDADYGRLDVLVNNAGISGGAFDKPSETDVDRMREVFETNVFGIVTITNAMLPLLLAAPAARIVQVSSEVGSIGFLMDRTSPMWSAAAISYPASKAALNMVTAMYAKELWDTPIKVNAANPGYCATEFNGNTGFRTAEQGAQVSVALATLPEDGPTGQLWGYRWGAENDTVYGRLPW